MGGHGNGQSGFRSAPVDPRLRRAFSALRRISKSAPGPVREDIQKILASFDRDEAPSKEELARVLIWVMDREHRRHSKPDRNEAKEARPKSPPEPRPPRRKKRKPPPSSEKAVASGAQAVKRGGFTFEEELEEDRRTKMVRESLGVPKSKVVAQPGGRRVILGDRRDE